MKNKSPENYLILLCNIKEVKYIYTLVNSHADMSKLFNAIDSTQYMVMTVTPLANVRDFKDVYTELISSKKPTNLEFGTE